jgi:lipid A ethanolaminephosphotransferase
MFLQKLVSKDKIKLTHFVLVISGINFILFHLPFFVFVFQNLDYKSFTGVSIVASLFILMLVLNAFVFYLIYSASTTVGKFLTVLFFLVNSVAVYFVNSYSVIIDESMVGNVLNTNYAESSSFFSYKLILYIVLFGILPSIFVIKAHIVKDTLKGFLIKASLTLIFIAVFIFANASNWLWIDKYSKQLGGLAMPWSYTVNLCRFYIHKSQENKEEIQLPNATITNNEKSVVVLVIGESARSENFALYGYKKNTNPYLSKTENVHTFKATSCATYTTAGVKCILEHAESDDLYEILPNYLYRNNVEVIWRTTNWGEPPVHIKNYQTKEIIEKDCKGEGCNYDEILITDLKQQILTSKKNKILIVLHTSTSHGPTYSKKYPASFETFKPVCNSVELGNCSQTELVNAYDNTIIYTDYLLHQIIEDLKELKDYRSAMLFVSDHGESLGEKNLYMHGLPMSIAPNEQFDIPFIVWSSNNSKPLKDIHTASQHHVFHSVLNFLDIKSPVYNEQLSIFK